MKIILTGKVLWSYNYEVIERSPGSNIIAHFSGVSPFHTHEGEIMLTETGIYIKGDIDLTIPLAELNQLYLGFDDTFPNTLVKNLGLFWQPLRIQFTEGLSSKTIYLIIDYHFLTANNKTWYNTLKEIFS